MRQNCTGTHKFPFTPFNSGKGTSAALPREKLFMQNQYGLDSSVHYLVDGTLGKYPVD